MGYFSENIYSTVVVKMFLFCVSSFGLFFRKVYFSFLHIKRGHKNLEVIYVDPEV